MTPGLVDFWCSQLSHEAGEQLFGTAANATTVWLVLEYPATWGAKALQESQLPDSVKERLAHVLDAIPGSRFQFIKQQPRSRSEAEGIRFFVGSSHELESAIYEFRLGAHTDLLELDVPAIVARTPQYDEFLRREPLFLVCTNAKRDRCCARWGIPLYQAMSAYAGDAVWQTTHTGGHRFAPTMICLPFGVFYGRVELDEVPALVDGYRRGEIYNLRRYRGRSCYDCIVQAADYYVRAQTGNCDLSAFRLDSAEQVTADEWLVCFGARSNGAVHRLRVREVLSSFENPLSCALDKRERVPQYQLAQYEVLSLSRS